MGIHEHGVADESERGHTLKLDRGPTFGAGVGVEALVVCRLIAVAAIPLGLFRLAEGPLCLADVLLLVRGPCLSSSVGAGGRTVATAEGRTNMPCAGLHVKYRTPFTSPSFLPVGPFSSIPTHCPSEKSVRPRNRTVAVRPSLTVMLEPI